MIPYVLSYTLQKINQTLCSATENGFWKRWLHSTLRLVCIQCGWIFMQNMLITLFWKDFSLLFRKEEKKASFKPRENTVERTCKGVRLLSIERSPLSYSESVCASCNGTPKIQPIQKWGPQNYLGITYRTETTSSTSKHHKAREAVRTWLLI